jgi:hypothetical protein
MVEEGTDYTVVQLATDHSAKCYAQLVIDGWVAWAGPPERVVPDGEHGFASAELTQELARAGTMYVPPAAYAPWQKGRVERKNATVRGVIRRSVLHSGVRGAKEMRLLGFEAASAINHRPGPSGVSASLMLFGE